MTGNRDDYKGAVPPFFGLVGNGASVPAHIQPFVHKYAVAYPEHGPREGDPHYRTFEAYRRRTRDTAKCQFGVDRGGDFSECDRDHPLELHHFHVEWAMLNEVDFAILEHEYPGISDPSVVGAWIESAPNLLWLCRWHHRGHGGVHTATSSDFEASHFVRHLIR